MGGQGPGSPGCTRLPRSQIQPLTTPGTFGRPHSTTPHLTAPGHKRIAAQPLVPDQRVFGCVGHVVPHPAVPRVTSRTAVEVEGCHGYRVPPRVVEIAKLWRVLAVFYVDADHPAVQWAA